MEKGNIVEYIDHQKIVCAVVIEVKKQRLRLLTENNREVNLYSGRLAHRCKKRLDLSMGRDKTVDTLKKIANKRKGMICHINIKELWEVLNEEQEWIDLDTMTAFCFPENPNYDNESAVVRAFFSDRLYFKFNNDRFFPNTEEQVEKKIAQEKEAARKNRMIQEGADWLKSILNDDHPTLEKDKLETVNLLKPFYLFQTESKYGDICKAMLSKAGIDSEEGLFRVLVKLGVFDANENTNIYRLEIPTTFSEDVVKHSTELALSRQASLAHSERTDLTALPLMTIDGQLTLDFDDAISIEDLGDHFRLGIHIVDVGHFIEKGDIVDREALARGSSIYMPDQKIPMLPSRLAEDLCSLKVGQLRPAISIMVNIGRSCEIIDYEIIPSLIKVKHQFSYYDVNMMADSNKDIVVLREIAEKFRQKRMDGGAVQITLPDINIWVNGDNEVTVNRVNRESPGRMLVSELMIMANWLMAKFLAKHHAPAIYRTQAAPKERLYKGNDGTLFQNWMQRRLLSRFVLNHEPEYHSGLGLSAYVTATSPIRKYFDLATQRQIRAFLGLETLSTPEEIDHIMQLLEQPMSHVIKMQYSRHRYWLLKYLEKRIGQKEEAIVLNKRRHGHQILISEYMIECDLPLYDGIDLKPKDLIQVTIQHASARKDLLSVFMS
jgi:exoribonuclease-2